MNTFLKLLLSLVVVANLAQAADAPAADAKADAKDEAKKEEVKTEEAAK